MNKIIKVCGITQEQQATQIAELGATHIGVVYFEKSPRNVDISKIKSIKQSIITKNTKLVAVVVNPEENIVKTLLEIVDLVQLHGDETIEFAKKFDKSKIIKAFRVKDESSINLLEPFIKEDIPILIDAYKEGEYGGTGKQIDLKLVKKVKAITDNFILSGGLSEKNVYKLIKEVKPAGVDASSKLEKKEGIKNLEKVKQYIKNAQKAFEEIS